MFKLLLLLEVCTKKAILPLWITRGLSLTPFASEVHSYFPWKLADVLKGCERPQENQEVVNQYNISMCFERYPASPALTISVTIYYEYEGKNIYI